MQVAVFTAKGRLKEHVSAHVKGNDRDHARGAGHSVSATGSGDVIQTSGKHTEQHQKISPRADASLPPWARDSAQYKQGQPAAHNIHNMQQPCPRTSSHPAECALK